MIKKYNKLVRDEIPEIIRRTGGKPLMKELTPAEYIDALHAKIYEEVSEYLDGYNIEELGDIIEVVYAIAESKGVSAEGLDRIRRSKKEERGAYDKKQFLVSVERD